MVSKYLSVCILFFAINSCFSQNADSAVVVTASNVPLNHSPKKAAIMSAILPGLGQVYNKDYWKPPLIYAGAAGLIYMFSFNQSKYSKYHDAYKYRTDNDVATVDNYTSIYSDNSLYELQKHYHRFRDLAVIGGGVLYILNVIDASVSAHLLTFDVSDDLSFHIQPQLNYVNFVNNSNVGLKVTLKF
jgi:Family of unknown function (DUF5683)